MKGNDPLNISKSFLGRSLSSFPASHFLFNEEYLILSPTFCCQLKMRSSFCFFWSCFVVPLLAQRPSNASLCDYYALQLYGSNTSTTQFNLVQNILALAFAGGSGLSNVSSSLTGIFNPGSIELNDGSNLNVDLRSWFNGSLDSTNVNGQPAAVNWLNGGGKEPLTAYLTGATEGIVIGNTTNE